MNFLRGCWLSYSDYFDIIRDTSYKDLSVAAEAAFHSFLKKYVLVKKAQLWAAEAHEYVFFIRTGHLDEETFRTYNDALLEEGLSRVEPKKDHMYTYVSVVFLAESIALKCLSLLKRHAVTETIACRFMVGWITVSQHMTVLRKGFTQTGRDDR